jgi:double-strand break repair protein AddB
MLTRQVTSALDRWGILPDDSAGTPAQLTPPGRFLRHVAALFTGPLDAESLLVLLKHPLTHSGEERGAHGLNVAALELRIRRKGWPYPQPNRIRDWGDRAGRAGWSDWVAASFCDRQIDGRLPLADWVARHAALAEAIAAGPGAGGAGALWQENAGRAVRALMDSLRDEAGHGTEMTAGDYADLVGALLAREEVRDRDKPHPHIRIWGTLEARVMGADLLILAGLNEGTWPEAAAADPWLNRSMRAEAGLLLPERRVGLSAHDFQQAAAASEVWLCRSAKSAEAETVPARWMNRLTNLLQGLPGRGGPKALEQMRARGAHWLALSRIAEKPVPAPRATRPAPAPPLEARPKALPVTAIRTLIRDPYSIHVRYILRLRELDPLMRAPDALMRGVLLHDVLERYLTETLRDPARLTAEALTETAERIVGDPETVPFPAIRALWQARMAAVAPWFVRTERERQARAAPDPARFEISGSAALDGFDFTLTAKADRVDIDPAGRAWLYDYKTGKAPTPPEQGRFDKQLLLEAAILARGGFQEIAPRQVAGAEFLSLAPGGERAVPAPLDEAPPEVTWDQFAALIAAYADADKGYSARRALMKDSDTADHDHLSRFGEWDVSDEASTERLR